MRRTIPSVLLAALLALAFGIAPAAAAPNDNAVTEDTDRNDGTPNNVADDGDNAHPSGNDRSVEHGGSGNQGKATSDPDDDTRGPERTNGGADKADGPGGRDLADQDGNNGCGNDDDFEDDNEGHCRRARTTADGSATGRKGEASGGARPAGHSKAPDTGSNGGGSTGETKPGNGTADITVDAECNAVSVTSSKDISHVVVNFADGTSTKFEGLSGHTWSKTFTETVASASAKSATTVVSDMADGCAAAAAASSSTDECEDGAMTEACDTHRGNRTENGSSDNDGKGGNGNGADNANGNAAGNAGGPCGQLTGVCAMADGWNGLDMGDADLSCDADTGAHGCADVDDDVADDGDDDGEVLGAGATAEVTPDDGGFVHALAAGDAVLATLASTVGASTAGSVVGALAFTGFDVARLAALGFGLVFIGLIARRTANRSNIG